MNPKARFWLVFSALLLLAWSARFIQDDAFISFRYAENLVRGEGLVFNPGERVAGFTNLLWTILIAFGIRVGFDPIGFSWALGLLSFGASLIGCFRLGQRLFSDDGRALMGMVVVGTNFSFLSYATGGLETQLQAALFIWGTEVFFAISNEGRESPESLLGLSAILAAAFLTRPDSGLWGALIWGHVALRLLREGRFARLGWFSALFFGTVAGWMAGMQWFYGDPLPNTFYTKVGTNPSLVVGFHFVYAFFLSYLLFFHFFMALSVAPWERYTRDWSGPRSILLQFILLWVAFVVKVGGDFMEFRFMVPVWPFMALLFCSVIFDHVSDEKLRRAFLTLFFIGSIHHAVAWGLTITNYGIQGTAELHEYVSSSGEDWSGIGKFLGSAFGGEPGFRISTTPAGAIPFYSKLETIDMLGLNDRWVARNGVIEGLMPGHQRRATLPYLVGRSVTLVIGDPWLATPEEVPARVVREDFKRMFLPVSPTDTFPGDAVMVAVPVRKDRVMICLYLNRHPAMERMIAREGWKTIPIRP